MLTKSKISRILQVPKTDSTLNTHGQHRKEVKLQMVVIDYQNRKPIYEQIVERFQMLIVKGIS